MLSTSRILKEFARAIGKWIAMRRLLKTIAAISACCLAGPASGSPSAVPPDRPLIRASRAGDFDDAVADSVRGYSGVQGMHGWGYGVELPGVGFRPLARFAAGVWRDGATSSPKVTVDSLVPGRGMNAVRRWKPVRAGSERLVGRLQKPTGGRAVCRVLVNGSERWILSLAPGDTIPHCFDILLSSMPKGALVDVIVAGAPVIWKAQILDEPCTAWHPGLPIGPQFTDVQKRAQRDAGSTLLARMNALPTGSNATIPSGDYRFSGDAGRYPHVRNLQNVQINARGVTFWFDAPLIHGLEFDDCRNVSVTGLTIDCDPLPFFQARITAIDLAAGTVTAELMTGYAPTESSGNRTVSYYRPDGSYIRNGIIGCSWARRPGADIVDIKAPAPGVRVGDYLACVIRTGQQLRSIGCGGMRYTDLNVYAGGGMAVIESGGPGGSVYTRVRCTRRPGTNRLHAFGADGFHFSGVGQGPVLDRCEAAYLADDEVNLHGQFGQIARILAPDHYLLTGAYYSGQTLDFWGFKELEPLGSAKVVRAVRSGDEGTWDVTLSESLALPADALIDKHVQTTGCYIVRNCWFHDTGQRYLINGAPYGTTRNCTFQNVGGDIDIGNESWNGYTEGAFPTGTLFVDNRVLNVAGGLNVALNPGGRPGRDLRRSTPIHDVTISGNDFDGTRPIIDASEVDGLVIRDNVFDRPFSSLADTGLIDEGYGDVFRGPIRLCGVTNGQVSGNIAYEPEGTTQGSLVTLGPLTHGIIVDGEAQPEVVADSLSSWYPEAQGGRGWWLGEIEAEHAQAPTYTVAAFRPLSVLEGGAWKSSRGNGRYPFVGKTDEHPSRALAAVRRWICTVKGGVTAEGIVQTPGPGGNGTELSIFVAGVRQWQVNNGDHQPHRFRVPLRGLKTGSAVDFVLDSRGDMDYDYTRFYVKIVVPPGTGNTSR